MRIGARRFICKEVVGIHVLLARSLLGAGITRRLLLRASLMIDRRPAGGPAGEIQEDFPDRSKPGDIT
jgi:hypothetical protein